MKRISLLWMKISPGRPAPESQFPPQREYCGFGRRRLPFSKGGVRYSPFVEGDEGGFGDPALRGSGVLTGKLCIYWVVVFLLMGANVNALPSYQDVRKSYVKSDSLLLDRHGEILHELRTDKDRRRLDWTSIGEISPALQEAVIQAEDKRFYDHRGVDYMSMAGALVKGLTSESLRGASTITMQLASLLDRELHSKKGKRSIWQKQRQVLRAWEIEKNWSKTEILEAYLNLVTFRGELQGISAASRSLFGKDPHGLNRAESIILASFIRSPNAASVELLKRAALLGQAMKWQIEDREMTGSVRQAFLGSNFLRPRATLAPHVARQLLRPIPDGSAVACTIESKIQRFCLERLAHHLLPLRSQNVKDGAVLVMDNRTGEILAYVSHSGEPSRGRFVDAVQARRQAGSTLKPFLYGLAFDMRILTPASLLDDSPLDVAVLTGIYQPRNYDAQFKGWVTSRVALASSLNVPAVKTLSMVGVEPFLSRLRQLGLRGLNEPGDFYGLSLAIGSADVNLYDLVNAYRTLANEGEWSEPRLAANMKTASRKIRLYSREAAFLISDILSDRDARSITFGLENALATRFWTAVKTGTSKDMRDNWCIGYSRKYTVGVWAGNFSGEPMWNVSGVTGAAPVWIDLMNFLHRNDPGPKREVPVRIVKKKVEFHGDTGSSGEEWFIRGTEPDSAVQRVGQINQRIVYPPPGAVIGLDPDIPPELQRVFFISQTNEEGLQWMLNGTRMDETGKTISWEPIPGRHRLALADEEGKILDLVYFEVRGPLQIEIPISKHQ